MNKGFTLIELIVAVIIVGLLAVMAIANFQEPLERSRAKNAIFNLQTIYNAQKRYYLDEKKYYLKHAGTQTQILEGINENLSITIKDDFFNYSINILGSDGYKARATRIFCNECKCQGKSLFITDANNTVDKKGCKLW